MQTNKIDILVIQETTINQTKIENRKKYTWYFSGDTKRQSGQQKRNMAEYTEAGVAIVLNNKYKRNINTLHPISDRPVSYTHLTLPTKA